MTKDYYRILGVLDDAEDIVIRAAYKVLAQKYHPDKWKGDKAEATRRMSDINEAYGVLSDTEKRKQYDSTRDKAEYQDDVNDEKEDWESFDTSIDEAWRIGVEFYPELKEQEKLLRKINTSLANTFRLILIENKCFDKGREIATNMETEYLNRYFGKNEKIIKFVKSHISMGNKKALLLVNKYINVMGESIKPELIIQKVNENFQPNESYKVNQKIITLATKIYYSSQLTISLDCQELLQLLHIELEIDKSKKLWVFKIGSENLMFYLNTEEFIVHVKIRYAKKILSDNGLI